MRRRSRRGRGGHCRTRRGRRGLGSGGWEGGPVAAAAALDRPRQVDPDPVVVPLDEVKTKAPPPTGRKEVWTSTAVVPRAGWRDVLVDATKPGRFEQLAAMLHRLGVDAGFRHREWAGWWPDRSLRRGSSQNHSGDPDRAQAGLPVPERSGISQSSQELHNVVTPNWLNLLVSVFLTISMKRG